MIVIIDDALPESVLNMIKDDLPNLNTYDTWYGDENKSYVDVIKRIAEHHFDLDSYIGYEMHVNVNNPSYHYDKDEEHFKQTGELLFPICSCVYYPIIENMQGGELSFDDVYLKPKTNRLVCFSSNLQHGALQHTGARISLGINLWHLTPKAYAPD